MTKKTNNAVKSTRIDKNLAEFQIFFDELDDLKSPVEEKLIAKGSIIAEQYFTAPASAQKDMHCCWPGGLLEHSINVTKLLKRIYAAMSTNRDVENKWIVFTGLFHDIGKTGDGKLPYYIENDSDWHREKLGKLYTFHPNVRYMTTAQRSLYLIQKSGIELPWEVYQAILLHDGWILEGNRSYIFKEYELARFLQFADYHSSVIEKNE